MEYEIRKELQEALIEELEGLEYMDTSEVVFEDVIKYPTDIFDGFIASVQFGNRTVTERNMDYDKQLTTFRIVFGELVEANTTQEVLDVKTDRLADAEDRIFNLLEKIPNAFESLSPDYKVIDVGGLTSIPLIQQTNRGIELLMDISATFTVDIQVKIIE